MGLVKAFTLITLQPIGEGYETIAVKLQGNQNLPVGTAVAQITSATQNARQTITAPVSGNFYLSFLGKTTGAIAYNASDSDIQTALAALSTIGAGNVAVASAVVTFQGSMAGMPQPTLSDPTGAATIAITQIGRTQYAVGAYSSATITDPTTKATISDTGTGTWPAGPYEVTYTLVTSQGESLPAPVAIYLNAGSKKIRVAALSSLNRIVTAVNYYINGVFAKQTAVASGTAAQTDIDYADVTSAAKSTPRVSTAYSADDGTQSILGFIAYGASSDQYGKMSQGSGAVGDEQGSSIPSVAVFTKGRFNANDLSGQDAAGLAGRGHVTGSISTGTVRLF